MLNQEKTNTKFILRKLYFINSSAKLYFHGKYQYFLELRHFILIGWKINKICASTFNFDQSFLNSRLKPPKNLVRSRYFCEFFSIFTCLLTLFYHETIENVFFTHQRIFLTRIFVKSFALGWNILPKSSDFR